MFEIRVGNEQIFFDNEDHFDMGTDLLDYCNKRLERENKQKTFDTDKKIILAIKLYLDVTISLDYDDVYNLVFEKKDYYDIKYFEMDDLDIYNEYFEDYGADYLYPIINFDEIVLADKSPSECLELGFNIDEYEYRRAEYFRYDYDLEFLDFDNIKDEMYNNNDFRKWLRDNEYYYEIQDEIDGIVKDWEDEYDVKF